MYLLRDGKLVKIDITEDRGVTIAVKTMEVLKKEQSFQADKIVRDEAFILTFDCDKGKYNFMRAISPYASAIDGKSKEVYGTGWHQSKGDAIRDKQSGQYGGKAGYDVYFIVGNERVLIPKID